MVIAEALSSRVETIFLRAVELPDSDRGSYVITACGDDTALRGQVESLLRGGSSALATTLLRQAAGLTLLTTNSEVLPIRLERYDLEERLGQGAFGVVYRATQHTPVRRSVAVKVLRPGLDSAEIVRRFEAERQALAALDHPNIARIFDAGNMPDGRPYFVMELLQGQTFTEHCDSRRLGLRRRLELFLEVCAGVEHAHRRGILHRDLKPSNILVVERDDRVSVKVIDFGIARALGADIPFGTLATEVGRLMGTPEYMSPEQIDGEPSDVDTRADIYALGVVLYELLCGRLPFDSQRLRSSRLSELRRIVCEVEPPLPSRAWDGDAAGLVRAAESRGETASGMRRALSDEIAWVPMRALRKLASERYRSVSELSDDVRNYLDGRPLIAGPDSTVYRARKFIRRHRAPIAALSAIFVLLVAAVVGTTIGMINARQQRIRAELQLADLLLSRGQVALDQSQFIDAWDAFVQARQIRQRLGHHLLPADLGLCSVLYKADPPVAVLRSDSSGLQRISFIDGGRRLISSNASKAIEWDLATRRRVRELPFRVDAVSADSRTLYGCDPSGQLVAYDRKSMSETFRFERDADERFDDERPVTTGGQWIVATSEAVSVWDITSGKRIRQLPKLGIRRPIAAITLDGKSLLTGWYEGPVSIWTTDDWTERVIAPIPIASRSDEPKVFSLLLQVAISPDGKRAALGSWLSQIAIVDLESGATRLLPEASGEINGLAFSPDGKRLAAGGGDMIVRLWDVEAGKVARTTFGQRQVVRAAAFSPDGTRFATVAEDGEIRVWDPDAKRVEVELTRENPARYWPTSFPLSANGHFAIRLSDENSGDHDLWDVESGRRISQLDVSGVGKILGVPPVTESGDVIGGTADDAGTVFRWDGRTGQRQALVTNGTKLSDASFSRDARWCVTHALDHRIRMWNLHERRLLWETPMSVWCSGFKFSSDSRYVLYHRSDGHVDVVRTIDGSLVQRIRTVVSMGGEPWAYFIPGDSTRLIWTHANDQRPHAVSIEDGRELWVAGTQQVQRGSYTFTSDGKLLVIVNGRQLDQLDIHDTRDGKLLATTRLPHPTGLIMFSNDCSRLGLCFGDQMRVADLTMGPRLAASEQMRPTDGKPESAPHE